MLKWGCDGVARGLNRRLDSIDKRTEFIYKIVILLRFLIIIAIFATLNIVRFCVT